MEVLQLPIICIVTAFFMTFTKLMIWHFSSHSIAKGLSQRADIMILYCSSTRAHRTYEILNNFNDLHFTCSYKAETVLHIHSCVSGWKQGEKSHDKATAIKSLCSTHPLVSPWGLCSKSLNSHCRAAGALRLHGKWACQSISFWPPNWAGNAASLWMLTPAEGRMFSPQTDSVENTEHGLRWECNERDTQFE